MKTILLILVGKRKDSAVKVQQILTAWGCNIKTRLGIHDGVLENCSDTGLLILELVGKARATHQIPSSSKSSSLLSVRTMFLPASVS